MPDALLLLMQWVHAPAIASQIFNAKADYVLALKGNHPTLHEQVKDWFSRRLSQGFEGIPHSYDERIEKGHQRR